MDLISFVAIGSMHFIIPTFDGEESVYENFQEVWDMSGTGPSFLVWMY